MEILDKPIAVTIKALRPDERRQHGVKILPGRFGWLIAYGSKKKDWFKDAEIEILGMSFYFSHINLEEL